MSLKQLWFTEEVLTEVTTTLTSKMISKRVTGTLNFPRCFRINLQKRL